MKNHEELALKVDTEIKRKFKDVRNFPFVIGVGSQFRTAGKSISNKTVSEKYYASAYYGDEAVNRGAYKILKELVSEYFEIEEQDYTVQYVGDSKVCYVNEFIVTKLKGVL